MPELLRHLAEKFTPTCACGDGVRALACALSALTETEVYRMAYAAGRADLVAEQIAAQGERALNAQAARQRWDRNAKAAWWADCACAACQGAPVDGWCRCVFCQVAGFVGERVFRHEEHPAEEVNEYAPAA
ncbi:hypothetical protein [uncultured Micrococcus sp.]|uniref:hypothetical protein n=1 Tax=uncultured Micrococcus sp. TaxID=114051 RepID=UPI00261031B0|nr:hypothetical protein [uncultured Micrococcus sp.]